ncbi:unnamed protein product [Pedinophyceae sp. YPF-701]|nr:unnamed protein product [Pedinophyceae sp. YPF-701]
MSAHSGDSDEWSMAEDAPEVVEAADADRRSQEADEDMALADQTLRNDQRLPSHAAEQEPVPLPGIPVGGPAPDVVLDIDGVSVSAHLTVLSLHFKAISDANDNSSSFICHWVDGPQRKLKVILPENGTGTEHAIMVLSAAYDSDDLMDYIKAQPTVPALLDAACSLGTFAAHMGAPGLAAKIDRKSARRFSALATQDLRCVAADDSGAPGAPITAVCRLASAVVNAQLPALRDALLARGADWITAALAAADTGAVDAVRDAVRAAAQCDDYEVRSAVTELCVEGLVRSVRRGDGAGGAAASMQQATQTAQAAPEAPAARAEQAQAVFERGLRSLLQGANEHMPAIAQHLERAAGDVERALETARASVQRDVAGAAAAAGDASGEAVASAVRALVRGLADAARAGARAAAEAAPGDREASPPGARHYRASVATFDFVARIVNAARTLRDASGRPQFSRIIITAKESVTVDWIEVSLRSACIFDVHRAAVPVRAAAPSSEPEAEAALPHVHIVSSRSALPPAVRRGALVVNYDAPDAVEEYVQLTDGAAAAVTFTATTRDEAVLADLQASLRQQGASVGALTPAMSYHALQEALGRAPRSASTRRTRVCRDAPGGQQARGRAPARSNVEGDVTRLIEQGARELRNAYEHLGVDIGPLLQVVESPQVSNVIGAFERMISGAAGSQRT